MSKTTQNSPIGYKCTRCRGTGLEPDQKAIGADLKLLRKYARITLREMARRLHVSHGFLCQLEQGNRSWKLLLKERYLKECERG